MRNISDKSLNVNQNTHFVLNNFFFFENLTVYEIMWKNTLDQDRPQHDNMAHARSMLST